MDNVSADFIFGTLATDARRLGYLKAELAGVSHRHQLHPADPIPDQPTTLTVSLGPTVVADHVTCYFSTDGSLPTGSRGVPGSGSQAVAFRRTGSRWDTFLWGYLDAWQAEVPPQPTGTIVQYRIEAWCDHETPSAWAGEIIGSTPGDGSVIGDVGPGDHYLREMGQEFNLTLVRRTRTFAYAVDTERPPDWLSNGVIYHVFVDRFHPGSDRAFANPPTPMGFYGGTLAGVVEHLDYIAALGTNIVWLSPIFPSPSHHGYDATDLYGIEPRLGSAADLHALIDGASARGMQVLLDYVPNHISSSHPVFQSALRDPDGPHGQWFTFTNHPDTYVSFFGVRDMPQLDNDHPEARHFVIEPACYWLRQGIAGFRLDYTIGPSHAFWTAFRAATRAVRPDAIGLGEAVDTADTLRTYYGRLDGCLDFLLLQMLRRFFAFGDLRASEFASFLQRHLGSFPADFVMPSFLDNHDMNRFLWVARGDLRRLKLAALCQYTLPHPPILYYGTEVGLSQFRDVRHADGSGHPEESRLPMRWGADQDRDLLAFYQQLGALRRTTAPVWRNQRRIIALDDQQGLLAYVCSAGPNRWLVALNAGPQAVQFKLPAGVWHLALATTSAELGNETLSLPPLSGALLNV
ncbi:MAG: alpha-amylase family glycosyl hydrolase [Oscillochloridaceae bacterium umkhey_bin13]